MLVKAVIYCWVSKIFKDLVVGKIPSSIAYRVKFVLTLVLYTWMDTNSDFQTPVMPCAEANKYVSLCSVGGGGFWGIVCSSAITDYHPLLILWMSTEASQSPPVN